MILNVIFLLEYYTSCPENTVLKKYPIDFHGDVCNKTEKYNDDNATDLPWVCPNICRPTPNEPFCAMNRSRLTSYEVDMLPCRVVGKLNTIHQSDFYKLAINIQ